MDRKGSAHSESEVAGAALVSRSAQSKRILLSNLKRGAPGFWAAGALIEGWGATDPDVAGSLAEIAFGPNQRAGWFAAFLPDAIGDTEQCYRRLLKLLADPNVDRPDFVMRGMRRLNRLRANSELTQVALARIGDNAGYAERLIVEDLIRNNPEEPGVRELALRELLEPEGSHAAVAEGYAQDALLRNRVAELVVPLTVDLRRMIAESLAKFGVRDPATLEICDDFPWEREPDIAATTSLALHRALNAQGAVSETAISRLRGELSCYGHYYESRRQAAYVAALELGRVELIDEATETIGDERPVRIQLGSTGEPNHVLIREVMAHWVDLEVRYPGATLCRFQGRRDGAATDETLSQEAWEEIADDIDREAGPERRVQEWLRDAADKELGPSLLRYLSRREPGSIRLREHCVRVLDSPGMTWGYEDRLEIATEILFQQFADDDLLWNRLEAKVREAVHLPHGAFAALLRSKPQCKAVQEHGGMLWSSPSGRSARIVFGSLCAVGTPAEVLAGADHYWGLGRRLGAWLYRPLVERMSRDQALRNSFEDAIVNHDSDAARVAFSVPLAASAPLPRTVGAALETLLTRELSGAAPGGFTFDARSGAVRSIASVVVELIQGPIKPEPPFAR